MTLRMSAYVFCLFIMATIGCNKSPHSKESAGDEASESKALPADLKKKAGSVGGAKILCFIQNSNKIIYALQTKNSTGTSIEADSIGHLFLLDSSGENFVRLSTPIKKSVEPGSDLALTWELPPTSSVGTRWRKEFNEPDVLQGRRFPSNAPFSLAYISTTRGAFEVLGSENVLFLISVGEDKWRQNTRTLEGGDIRSVFEKQGIELPPK